MLVEENNLRSRIKKTQKVVVTNFIWTYIYQLFDNFHSLNSVKKPLRRPFN